MTDQGDSFDDFSEDEMMRSQFGKTPARRPVRNHSDTDDVSRREVNRPGGFRPGRDTSHPSQESVASKIHGVIRSIFGKDVQTQSAFHTVSPPYEDAGMADNGNVYGTIVPGAKTRDKIIPESVKRKAESGPKAERPSRPTNVFEDSDSGFPSGEWDRNLDQPSNPKQDDSGNYKDTGSVWDSVIDDEIHDGAGISARDDSSLTPKSGNSNTIEKSFRQFSHTSDLDHPSHLDERRKRRDEDSDFGDAGRTIPPGRVGSQQGSRSIGSSLTRSYRVEFFNEDCSEWVFLARHEEGELFLGRSNFQILISESCKRTISENHAKIRVENDEIVIVPVKSRNGVYLKIPKGQRRELKDGDRFRLWRVVLEYRALPTSTGKHLGGSDYGKDETAINVVPTPLGYLHLIGSDDTPKLTFPLMKNETNCVNLGRKDGIILPYDQISRSHAKLEFKDQSVFLVDGGSLNGTFVRIENSGAKMKTAQYSKTRPVDSLVDEAILGDIRIRVTWIAQAD
ncbi:FHA domain-containing protein [bacterium]|nr:FHA domain-containing protein [bacterium]